MAALIPLLVLSGCINIVPAPTGSDRGEAMAFAKILYKIQPEGRVLLHDEQLAANDLHVTLEEAKTKEFSAYRQRFDTLIETMVGIRDKRRQLQAKIREGVWQSVLARLVQQNAIQELQGDIDRTINWIQLAHNYRLRAEVRGLGVQPGGDKPFPELPLLIDSLGDFLGEPPEDPMASQLSALRAEYHFREADLDH